MEWSSTEPRCQVQYWHTTAEYSNFAQRSLMVLAILQLHGWCGIINEFLVQKNTHFHMLITILLQKMQNSMVQLFIKWLMSDCCVRRIKTKEGILRHVLVASAYRAMSVPSDNPECKSLKNKKDESRGAKNWTLRNASIYWTFMWRSEMVATVKRSGGGVKHCSILSVEWSVDLGGNHAFVWARIFSFWRENKSASDDWWDTDNWSRDSGQLIALKALFPQISFFGLAFHQCHLDHKIWFNIIKIFRSYR